MSSSSSLVSTYRDILSTASRMKRLFKDNNNSNYSPPAAQVELVSLPEPPSIASRLRAAGAPDAVLERLNDAYRRAALKLRETSEDRLQLALSKSSGLTDNDWRSKFIALFSTQYKQKLEELADGVISRVNARFKVDGDVGSVGSQAGPVFNTDYLPVLEAYFSENARPGKADKMFLAEKSRMSYRQIHVWFQNKRRRTKKIASTVAALREGEQECVVVGVSKPARLSYSPSVVAHGSDMFIREPPAYAYPSVYPPSLPYDPFPCRFGDFSSFSGMLWERGPATQPFESIISEDSITSLVTAFGGLTIGGNKQHQICSNSARLPWGLSRPIRKSGYDVTSSYTVHPAKAPLVSLVRDRNCCRERPASKAAALEGNKGQESAISKPCYVPTACPRGGPFLFGSFFTPSSSSSAFMPTSTVVLSGKLKEGSTQNSFSRQPSFTPIARRNEFAHTTPAERSPSPTLLASCASPTPSPRSSYSDSNASLPSLSSAPSEVHSPATSELALLSESPESYVPDIPVITGPLSSILMSPEQNGFEVFPHPSLHSTEIFQFSKDSLGGAFSYALPSYQSYLQLAGASAQGLHRSYDFGMPPLFST